MNRPRDGVHISLTKYKSVCVTNLSMNYFQRHIKICINQKKQQNARKLLNYEDYGVFGMIPKILVLFTIRFFSLSFLFFF